MKLCCIIYIYRICNRYAATTCIALVCGCVRVVVKRDATALAVMALSRRARANCAGVCGTSDDFMIDDDVDDDDDGG